MARMIADQNQLSFIYESGTYGNSSGTRQWIGEVQDFSPDEATNVIPVRHQGDTDRNVSQFVDGPLDFTGTFTYFPQDWKFLMFALGSNVDGGADPKTHTMSEVNSDNGNGFTSGANNPFMSFTLESAQNAGTAGENFIRTINGCMVNNMTITAGQGEIISVDVDYIGQTNTFSSGAVTGLTEATTRPFLWSDSQVQLASGTAVDNVKTTTLSINNNMEGPHYQTGSREIDVPIPLARDYELSLTVDANSTWTKNFYDKYFIGGSTFNVLWKISATASREMFVTMSGCKLTDMGAPQGMEGVNEQTLTIQPGTCNALAEDSTTSYNPW